MTTLLDTVKPHGVGRREQVTPARWRRRGKLALVTPAVVALIVLTQIPFALSIYYSLLHWNFLIPYAVFFTGVQNYLYVFQDPNFWAAISNTFILTFGTVAISMLIGLPLALLLDSDIPGRNVLRVLLITPYFVMKAVSTIVWKDLFFNPQFGLVNWLLKRFGAHHIAFLSTYPRASIIAMSVWQFAPFMMLITLAGLQSRPVETSEAARVDGAGKWKEWMHITLPHLRKYLEIEFFLGIILELQMFGTLYIATAGGPGNSTTNLAYYAYLMGFSQWNVGEAAAVGVLAVIVTTIFATGLFRLITRFSEE